MATSLPSQKLSKTCKTVLEKPRRAYNSYWPPHMAEQKQDDPLEHTYSSCVKIRDVALETGQRRWTIGRSGERGSEISVLAARHDMMIYIYIYIYIELLPSIKNKQFASNCLVLRVKDKTIMKKKRSKNKFYCNQCKKACIYSYFWFFFFFSLMAYQSSWVI